MQGTNRNHRPQGAGPPPHHMIYTWWTPPKEGNGDETAEDDPSKKQPKRRRQRHRSKSHQSKDSNTGTGDDNTPDDAEDNEDLVDATAEQDEWEDGQVSPGKQATHEDLEDSNYLPLSEDEASLGTEDYIMPEEPPK